MALSSVFVSSPASASAASVFFMKANSSAKINIEFTFSSTGNWTMNPLVYSMPSTGGPVNSIAVVADPGSLNVTIFQPKYDITYTMTPKNNVTGIFEIDTGFCGRYYPIVVGLNESEVDPKIFKGFNNGTNFGCSPYQPDIHSESVIGYSGIIPLTLSADSEIWNKKVQSSVVPEFPIAISVLLISIILLIVFYRIKFT